MVNILSTVSDFHHCTVSDFCADADDMNVQLYGMCRPILVYCPFWCCDEVIITTFSFSG